MDFLYQTLLEKRLLQQLIEMLSSIFTELNDGITSAIISFLRTLVFESGAVMLLSFVLGINGIWSSVVVAEFMALILGVMFLIIKKKKYKY